MTIEIIEVSKNGNLKEVKKLLEDGINPNIQDEWENTSLMWASRNGHKKIVELLLEKGANLDIKNNLNKTALFYSTNKEIKYLLKNWKVIKRKRKLKTLWN